MYVKVKQHRQQHVHRDTQLKISYIYISKEWVSTKMGTTRVLSIKMIQSGAGTPIDTEPKIKMNSQTQSV